MLDAKLLVFSALLYFIAMIFYIANIVFHKDKLGKVATAVTIIGVALGLLSFVIRTVNFYKIADGNLLRAIPITNLFESLQFFALLLTLIYIVFEMKYKIRILGSFVTAISGATILFIDSIGASAKINPLVPALQSNWLLAHVSLSFISYVFFALSAVTALIYLICNSKKRSAPTYIFWSAVMGVAVTIIIALISDVIVGSINGGDIRVFSSTVNSDVNISKILLVILAVALIFSFWYYGINMKKLFLKFNLDLAVVDNYSYRFALIGFVIFTVGGLIFGAIWAEQAWGRYWSWDPKETWAFITWLIYGVYIHGRLYGKWKPNTANAIALFGFLMTIFTFLGVNLLLSGLHSYGSM